MKKGRLLLSVSNVSCFPNVFVVQMKLPETRVGSTAAPHLYQTSAIPLSLELLAQRPLTCVNRHFGIEPRILLGKHKWATQLGTRHAKRCSQRRVEVCQSAQSLCNVPRLRRLRCFCYSRAPIAVFGGRVAGLSANPESFRIKLQKEIAFNGLLGWRPWLSALRSGSSGSSGPSGPLLSVDGGLLSVGQSGKVVPQADAMPWTCLGRPTHLQESPNDTTTWSFKQFVEFEIKGVPENSLGLRPRVV